ncbi:hypothetical protein ACQKM2_13565 [Streptomyces sp. NPDC004126]|uniref:hypothetical protein n=1 Tax=Streptomyces sp. NPDC004126 TaxID=3390695 RepID=UPI003D09136B
MTTPSRERGLGRGVAQLIPQSPAAPAEQAAAALAALLTVPVHVGVLQAAVVLLDATTCQSDDGQLRAAAQATVAHLRKSMETSPAPGPGASGVGPSPDDSDWLSVLTPRAPE